MKAKARQLCTELGSTKTGSCTISAIILKHKSLIDSLASVGESISFEEQLDVMLEGLPYECESIVSLVSSKPDC